MARIELTDASLTFSLRKSKNVTLHKQGDCNFVINAEPGSYAEEYAEAHGPSACPACP